MISQIKLTKRCADGTVVANQKARYELGQLYEKLNESERASKELGISLLHALKLVLNCSSVTVYLKNATKNL